MFCEGTSDVESQMCCTCNILQHTIRQMCCRETLQSWSTFTQRSDNICQFFKWLCCHHILKFIYIFPSRQQAVRRRSWRETLTVNIKTTFTYVKHKDIIHLIQQNPSFQYVLHQDQRATVQTHEGGGVINPLNYCKTQSDLKPEAHDNSHRALRVLCICNAKKKST